MKRILAEVRVPALDPEEDDGIQRNDEGDVVYENLEVYLHHWGTQYEIIEDENNNRSVGIYTVAICEEGPSGRNPGQIHNFIVTQLKILCLTTYR